MTEPTTSTLSDERRTQFAVAVLLALVSAGAFAGGLLVGTAVSIVCGALVALGALFGAVTLAQDPGEPQTR